MAYYPFGPGTKKFANRVEYNRERNNWLGRRQMTPDMRYDWMRYCGCTARDIERQMLLDAKNPLHRPTARPRKELQIIPSKFRGPGKIRKPR